MRSRTGTGRLRVLTLLAGAVTLLAGTFALTACGQRGPLYLPDPATPAQRSPAPGPATAAEPVTSTPVRIRR
ncbi:MAG: lipoprotein [Burkholderiaceae bacterium]